MARHKVPVYTRQGAFDGYAHALDHGEEWDGPAELQKITKVRASIWSKSTSDHRSVAISLRRAPVSISARKQSKITGFVPDASS